MKTRLRDNLHSNANLSLPIQFFFFFLLFVFLLFYFVKLCPVFLNNKRNDQQLIHFFETFLKTKFKRILLSQFIICFCLLQ